MPFEIGHSRTRLKRRLLAFSALCALGIPAAILAAAPAQAETASARFDFDLPAQSLALSITRAAATAGVQVLYGDEETSQVPAPAVKGRMTLDDALGRLLAGSGFAYRYERPGVITLNPVKPAGNGGDGEKVTAVVSVEGAQGSPWFGGAGQAAGVNGTNGSRDITATEGTRSFTSGALTIGSKVPQALKDVPQSISVLTSERLEQQNVTDFTTAMQQLPGITLVQGDTSLQNSFFSRGFAVTSIQVDGGAPMTTQYGFSPQIDMSVYDHVELLRGADGQFGAYGDPGGTVNLVRKRPLDHSQFSVEAQVGSWQNYRIVNDATAPLGLDGALRGRLVMTWQDNHYFYDTAKQNKSLIYGIVELDATPSTLLTSGVNYTRQDSVPWMYGLPRYVNGRDLKLPRSSCLCFDWNRWDFGTTEIFGGVEQKVGDDWTAKLNLTYNRQGSTQKLGYSSGAVNPTNGLGAMMYGTYSDLASDQFSAEATISGAFMLFGQRQEITAGVNRAASDGAGQVSYSGLISGTLAAPYQPFPGGPAFYSGSPNGLRPPVDVLNFDPTAPLYTEPRNSLPSVRYTDNSTIQSGAYINLRLTAFDRLHLTTGLHWSRYERKFGYDVLCTKTTGDCASLQIGDIDYSIPTQNFHGGDFSWPPAVNLSFDVTKTLAAYIGYTDIYESQAASLDADLKPLPPVTGSNWEAGLKWAARDGKLNLSVAGYSIRQHGFGMIDPPDGSGYREVSPGVTCCYVVDPSAVLRSKGVDFELAGEIIPGAQISASYTYNDNKYVGQSYWGLPDGTPIVSIQPKQLYKLWMSYDFAAAGQNGIFSGLTLSVGVNGQSAGFNSGSTCVRLDPNSTPNPITGAQACQPDGYEDYKFTVPAYAVISARVDYRFTDKWSLAFNVENILDKTYYQTTGTDVSSGNWYGTPRSFTATLRAKW
ncbi:MAG: TonB-dependent siderophore receptor [Novosphingobium sp.]|nr:TonB-dependent siderophore receptor [Novosphingobium sp.]